MHADTHTAYTYCKGERLEMVSENLLYIMRSGNTSVTLHKTHVVVKVRLSFVRD